MKKPRQSLTFTEPHTIEDLRDIVKAAANAPADGIVSIEQHAGDRPWESARFSITVSWRDKDEDAPAVE